MRKKKCPKCNKFSIVLCKQIDGKEEKFMWDCTNCDYIFELADLKKQSIKAKEEK